MELQRSRSGELVFAYSAGARCWAALGLALIVSLIGAWVWARAGDVERFTWQHYAVIAAFGLLFYWFGGQQLLRMVLGERVALNPRRREITRNGRRLCGYGDVEELRIVIWKGRSQADQAIISYRLQMQLRDGELRWLGGEMAGEDEVNEASHSVAAELGVNVRVLN